MKPLGSSEMEESRSEMSNTLTEKFEEILFSDSDDYDSEIECDICCKAFSSVKTYEQHLSSRKHYKMRMKAKLMKKLDKDAFKPEATDSNNGDDFTEELFCKVCEKEFSGCVPYAAHLKGKSHLKQVKQHNMKEELKGTEEFLSDALLDAEIDEDGLEQQPFAKCSTCQKTFHCPESYQQHMKGANHKKKVRHLKLVESLKTDDGIEEDGTFCKCEICNKSFSGPVPYKIHLRSSAHGKELKKIEVENEVKEFFTKGDDADFICKECDKSFPDPFSCKSHLLTNSHGKKKVKDAMFEFVASNPEIAAVKSVQSIASDEESDEKDGFQNGNYFFVCKLCHMSFSGPESVQDHLKSRNHLKMKKEKAERKLLKEKKNELSSNDRKSANLGGSKGQKRESENGDINGSTLDKESADSLLDPNADDFELL